MSSETLTESLRETLALFDPAGAPRTTSEVAAALDLGRRSTYDRLDRLVDHGRLETKEVGASARVWWRATGGEGDAATRPTVGTGAEGSAIPASWGDGDRYRALLESIDLGFCIVEVRFDDEGEPADYRFLETNAAFEAETGLLDAEGRWMRELEPDHEEHWFQEYGRVARTGEPVQITDEASRLDDRRYDVQAFRVGRPEANTVAVLFEDVTERHETEAALRESEERLRLTLEAAEMGTWEIDPRTGDVPDASPEFDRIFGYEEPTVDWSFDRFLDHVHPDDRPAVVDHFESSIEAGDGAKTSEWAFECRILRNDRERRWIAARGEFSYDEEGRPVRSVGVVRDVTERKTREQELERYAGVVDAVGEPVYELDASGRFTFVNEPFVERSGYSEAELLGEHVSIGMDEESIARSESRMADLLSEGDRDQLTLEYEVVTKDEERIPVENRVSLLTGEDGTLRGSAGILRDITERRKRERELEESRNRYRTVVRNYPNGAVALVDRDLNYRTVGGTTFEAMDPTVEDLEGNPIEEVLPPRIADALIPRYVAAFEGEPSTFEMAVGERIYQLWVLPVRDDHGEVFAALGMSQDVTDRVTHERQLVRQREQLAALNNLNDIVHDITAAVIEQSTREEIEEIVCSRLADSDSYTMAWIGVVDVTSETVELRSEAGVEGYLDDLEISIDPGDDRSRGPTGRAILDREIQTSHIVTDDADFDVWHENAEKHGFSASAAIPILHGDMLYGVLNVYSDRPHAFTDDEQAVIGQLGEVVGHAIAAVDRKHALTSDEVVEVEFMVGDFLESAGYTGDVSGSVDLGRTVPVGDGEFMVYGTATGETIDAVRNLVDAESVPHWRSMTVLASEGNVTEFELQTVDPPILSIVADHGGFVDRALVEEGNFFIRLRLSPNTDVRHVLDRIEDAYESIVLVTQRQIARDPLADKRLRGDLLESLTDRQRSAIQAAYHAGFFEWPRGSNGESVSESLGVSPPTFHQHLRKAQQTILRTILEERRVGEGRREI